MSRLTQLSFVPEIRRTGVSEQSGGYWHVQCAICRERDLFSLMDQAKNWQRNHQCEWSRYMAKLRRQDQAKLRKRIHRG
jgi:hypothetical protein